MILLGVKFGDVARDGSANAKIKQAHVPNERTEKYPNSVGDVPKTVDDEGR